MALVKTGEFGAGIGTLNGLHGGKSLVRSPTANPKPDRAVTAQPPRKPIGAGADPQRRRQRTFGRQQKAAERVAAATSQMASGIAEAASACEELSKAMEQITTGAEQAASAAEESQRAMTRISASNRATTEAAELSVRKTETLQTLIANVSGQITASLASIGRSSERQVASVGMMAELDKQAANIGDIVKAVARIADQTNLLALNAAIEAARAGQHGKGFAVVADEVRTLAETSEKSARDIQDLVGQIQQQVKVIADGINASANAAKAEVESGRTVTVQLERVRTDMVVILTGGQAILKAAQESDGAAQEAQKGAEAISSAAQEQSAACEEAVNTVGQQTTALSQSEQASNELSELAEELKTSTDITKSAEEVASAAEQLSSAVEEINRASTQIMAALEQINRGTQQQTAATQQSAAAIAQIERGAQLTDTNAAAALEKGQLIAESLRVNRASLEQMIAGVQTSVESNLRSRDQISALEQVSRRIDKIVDTISTVSIQTNMLAVNGAIEAARAGEFGKGFMVVSTDIRNLARDSSENAEQIKDLVKSVQDQIVAVRRDIEETSVMALAEVEKNKLVTANLALVETDMGDVLDGNRSIAGGTAEILQALLQARQGVDQIAAAAVQASTAANQATQAAREQAKGAEELATAIEEISSLADELQNSDVA
jgi:methyl-accepting chemotaxis protein